MPMLFRPPQIYYYKVKLGITKQKYIVFIFALNIDCDSSHEYHNLCFEPKIEKMSQCFHLKIVNFYSSENEVYIA